MDKNFKHTDIEKAKELAGSPSGKQLLSQLRQADPIAFESAMKQVNSGNYSQLSETLAPLLASEEVQKILSQFGGN